MRDTLDIFTDGLAHDHNALELSVEYMKGHGNYFYLQPVEISEGCRSMILMGMDGSVRHFIDKAKRLNTKKVNAMRETIFAQVDRDKLAEWFKIGDHERIISEVLGALEARAAA